MQISRPLHRLVIVAGLLIGVLYLMTLVDGPFPTNKTGTLGQWVGGLGSLTAIGFTLWLDERRTQREVDERAAMPDVEVTLIPTLRGKHGWMIRLEVTNLSDVAWSFRASITDAPDMPPTGPEKPWPIPWRHSRERTIALSPQVPEFLLVGDVDGDKMVVNVHEYDGEDFTRHAVPQPPSPVRLRVTIMEAKQGRIASEHWLNIPVPVAATKSVAPSIILMKID